jgi:hypothetical protein
MRTALLIVSLWAPAALAHHSAAMFDVTKTVTVEGTVARYEWANPHVYLHLTTSSGPWLIEAGSPSMMERMGWTPQSFAGGDAVSVDVNPTRNGRRMGLSVAVRGPDGATLGARGQPAVAAAPPPPVPAKDLAGTWLPTPEPLQLPFILAPTGWQLTSEALEALARFDPAQDNPGTQCIALQSPFQMVWPELKNIELAGETVIIRSALNVAVERVVHLDRTTHDGAPFTNDGHSIGRWENGALVVDTRNFTDHPSGTRGGVPSSSRKHLVERFELSEDRTLLTYRFELEDPVYLAAPFAGSAVWVHRPDLPYIAEECDLENAGRYLEDP